eukprot:5208484-Ditylum_brightwellii.AAC.1
MATTAGKSTIKDVQATNQQLFELMQKLMDKMDWVKEDVTGGNNTGRGGRGGCGYYGRGGRGYGGYNGTGKKDPKGE